MNLLIVESPAKAKTIGKYLGPAFKVLSSYGHVRGLPSENGAVDPDQDFKMRYEIIDKSTKQIAAIVAEAKKSDAIYLATDPDREGEAISWHILEVLKAKKAIKASTKVKRAVFYEITKKAVLDAVENTREVDMSLVNAQQTRQALDYLVGFNLSPVLWRKLPGSRSAGRVQSVALRIICEREAEIESFKTQEYWSICAIFAKEAGENFEAALVQFQNQKLEKLEITSEEHAAQLVASLQSKTFSVKKVEKKQIKKNPQPPFSTSTLIQAASRQLGFSAKRISQIAQKLYEGISIQGELIGLITYMRTDSIRISPEAASLAKDFIAKTYGKEYVPDAPRIYKSKAKNTQEAHEAIRPTDVSLVPNQIKAFLEEDQYKLYSLIWNRLVASQMASAILDVVAVEIASEDQQDIFRTSGSTVLFPGFYKVYRDEQDTQQTLLPILLEGEALDFLECNKKQHFTQAQPRYTEASLVKRMEELGIGRPSTYASVISILQDRKYATVNSKRFFAEDRGRLVNAFLTLFFERYVEYEFTANLENELDEVARGKTSWKEVLKCFWHPFKGRTIEVLETKTAEILAKMENMLLPYLYKDELASGDKSLEEIKKCPKCDIGQLVLKNGRYGSFIACSSYPTCAYIKKAGSHEAASEDSEFPRVLGVDPATQEEISIRKGPYGVYLQRGEGKKVKRVSLPQTVDRAQLDVQRASALLSMPREVGFSTSGEMINAGFNKFGSYLECGGKFYSLKKIGADPMAITLQEATSFLQDAVATVPRKKQWSKAKAT